MAPVVSPHGQSDDSSSTLPLVPNHRISGLDGLRAVSIALVIFSHVVITNHFDIGRDLTNVPWGRVGVEVFFVLSGFLITSLLLKEQTTRGRVDMTAFYLRRAVRILPPAMLYLAAIAVLTAIGVYHVPAGDFAACVVFVRNVFTDFPFTHHYYSDQTSHYWSLSIEEQFYVLWPALLLAGGKKIARRAGWSVALLPICAIYLNSYVWKHPIFTPVRYFSAFGPILLGCLLALYRDATSPIRPLFIVVGQRGWIAVAAVSGAVFCNYIPHFDPLISLARSAAFALVINYLIEAPSSFTGRMLNLPSIAYVGRLSYSLYLWQQIFCWADPKSTRLRWEQFPLNVGLACLMAMLSYHLVELPSLRLRDRIMRSWRPRPALTPLVPTPVPAAEEPRRASDSA